MKSPYQANKRSRMTLYVSGFVVVALLMFMLRMCSERDSFRFVLGRSAAGDTINVAIEYSPLSVYTYDDTLGGLNYDIVNALARENGVAVKFHPFVSLEKAISGLEEQRYDVVVADIPLTVEYQRLYRQTVPVYLDKMVLVQKRDSLGQVEIKSQLDIAGKHVRVVAGSPAVSRLRNLAAEIGDTIYVDEDETYSQEQLFLLVASGEVPYAVVNEQLARKMASGSREVDITTDVSFTQFQTWILRKGDATRADSLDAMINRFKETDEYQGLLKRYLK